MPESKRSDRERAEPAAGADAAEFERTVAVKERRLRRARAAGDRGVWFGLGMFGMVGWSVSIPLVLGTLLGAYFDRRFGTGVRWTLALMTLGFVFGASNAWNWVQREQAASHAASGTADAPRTRREDDDLQ